MPTGMKRRFELSIHELASRIIYSMSMKCGMKLGMAWQNAKVIKPQDITTVVLVNPKDVTGAPRNRGEKIAMQVTKRVKRGVHVDPTVTVIMPLKDAIYSRL